MQKILTSAILVTQVFSLMSCGRNQGSKAAPSPSIEPELPAPPDIGIANPGDSDLLPLPASGVPRGWNSWQDFNLTDPASRSQIILDGHDPAQELLGEDPLCSIFILASYLNEKNQPTYVIRTSFRHNNQTHGYLLLSLGKDDLSATGAGDGGRDQIFFKFRAAGDFLSAQSMNLKWFHINHYDTGVCESLYPRGAS